MQLDEYVLQVQNQLSSAAALGDARTQEIAQSLAVTAGPFVQLALLSALAEAAEEITAALLDFPGAPAVTTRWDGSAVQVEVATGAEEPVDTRPDDGDATARITLRLTDALKAEIDAAAAREGVSVNTWIARAAASALRGAAGRRPGSELRTPNTHRVTGWING